MKMWLRLSRGIDGLNTAIGRTACWAIVAAIVVSTVNALMRKIFGLSSNAWLELQWYLFGAVFMLCAPWTLRLNEHIRIDVVAEKFGRRASNIIEVTCHVLFLLTFCALMIWLSVPFVWNSFHTAEVSTNAGGLLLWPAKLIILVGFVLLFLQGVSELIKRIAIMRGDLADDGGGDAHAVEAERILTELAETDARIGGAKPC